ncbi:MAG: hypothetical protein V7638_2854 [Acidobacteriota bacterium]
MPTNLPGYSCVVFTVLRWWTGPGLFKETIVCLFSGLTLLYLPGAIRDSRFVASKRLHVTLASSYEVSLSERLNLPTVAAKVVPL